MNKPKKENSLQAELHRKKTYFKYEIKLDEKYLNSPLWKSVGYRCNAQYNVAASVKNGQIEDSPEEKGSGVSLYNKHYAKEDSLKLSKVSVSENGAKNGREVAEHCEKVVEDSRLIFIVQQYIPQIKS